MRRALLLMMMTVGLPFTSWAIPSKITYQGTLKEKSLPVNATKTMRFRITNQSGTQVYWSSIDMSVAVTNGLFSAELDPTGVNWQSITPYIEVSIEGQTLAPREPLNASVYSNMSADIVDGVVTPTKLAPSVQDKLVPVGAIILFAGSCPSGWSHFAALDNKFARGGDAYGGTGGSDTHSHSISQDGAHNHGGLTGQGDAPSPSNAGNFFSNQQGWHRHSISTDGGHNHGGATGSGSSLPAYVTMVYCQKN